MLRRRQQRAAAPAAVAGKQLVILSDTKLLSTVQRILMNWGIDPSLFMSLDTGALGLLLEAGIAELTLHGGKFPDEKWWMPELQRILAGEPRPPR